MKIHVLFPTFNRPQAAVSLVRQLGAQTHRDLDITCVDHGASPVDFSIVEDARLTVLRGGTELWWTGAMNKGLEHILSTASAGDAVLTINDDVKLDPGYVAVLAEALRAHPRALIGSVCIDDATDRVLYADLHHLPFRGYFRSTHGGQPSSSVPSGEIRACDVQSGRGTIIPAAAFREVGLYDDARLPHYGADYELSRRAHDKGFALLCATDARVRTAAPPTDTAAGYGSFFEFAMDGKRAGRVRDKWTFYRVSFGRRQAAWSAALELYRLGKIYVRERYLGKMNGER